MRILLLLWIAEAARGGKLGIDFSTDELFSITVAGTPWLEGDGSSLGHRLRPSGPWRAIKGEDARGKYKGRVRRYSALKVSYAVYADAIVFTQLFPDGATATASSRGVDGLVSEWPVLGPSAQRLGVLTFGGRFMEKSRAVAWTGAASLESGAYGGPFVLFDGTGNAVVVSAAGEFTAHSHAASARNASAVAFGVLGSVTKIPKGFAVATVLTLGQEGITAAVKHHGQALLRASGTRRASDYATQYLGYATDNGAYYYYNPQGNYDATLRAVHAYAAKERIPYRYALLDSWWYEKGSGDGVRNWSCTAQAFPGGCQSLSKELGWKFMLHNREWSADNVYTSSYNFAVEPLLALPLEQRFWDDLLRNATLWGMVVYEQDWLYTEFLSLNATLQSVNAARQWLTQMATAAARVGVSIQYCMEMARFVLQSVALPAVTQIRASDDYNPAGDSNCTPPACAAPVQSDTYYIGTTSLFAWALDLAPSKDSFWSTSTQPGNPYGNVAERYPEMQAAVATLSRGPVQVSDGVGYSDHELILRTCDEAGRLLQPSRPATALDVAFHRAAEVGDGPLAKIPNVLPITTTHTRIDGWKWAHVLVINLAEPFTLRPEHLAPTDLNAGEHVVYEGTHASDFSRGVAIPPCGAGDFRLYHVAPKLANGWAYLGELVKFVPVSEARTRSLKFDVGGVAVSLSGAAGEIVAVTFLAPNGTVVHASCVLSAAGLGEVRVW